MRRRDDELFCDDVSGVILSEDLNIPHIPYEDQKNRSTGPGRDRILSFPSLILRNERHCERSQSFT